MSILKFDPNRRDPITPETQAPAPPTRRTASAAQRDHYIEITSLRHPLGYEHFQRQGWCEIDEQDLLGTDRWPVLTVSTHLNAIDAILAWRGRSGRLRLWYWEDDETTLYDPVVYKRLARRYPYSTFVRDVQRTLEDNDAFTERMDERWLAQCPPDAYAAVTFSAGGHILEYRPEIPEAQLPRELAFHFGWPDRRALRLALKAYSPMRVTGADRSVLERALTAHFQERK